MASNSDVDMQILDDAPQTTSRQVKKQSTLDDDMRVAHDLQRRASEKYQATHDKAKAQYASDLEALKRDNKRLLAERNKARDDAYKLTLDNQDLSVQSVRQKEIMTSLTKQLAQSAADESERETSRLEQDREYVHQKTAVQYLAAEVGKLKADLSVKKKELAAEMVAHQRQKALNATLLAGAATPETAQPPAASPSRPLPRSDRLPPAVSHEPRDLRAGQDRNLPSGAYTLSSLPPLPNFSKRPRSSKTVLPPMPDNFPWRRVAVDMWKSMTLLRIEMDSYRTLYINSGCQGGRLRTNFKIMWENFDKIFFTVRKDVVHMGLPDQLWKRFDREANGDNPSDTSEDSEEVVVEVEGPRVKVEDEDDVIESIE